MKKGKTHENGIKEDPWTGVITSCETKTSPSWPAQFASGSGRRQTYKRREPRQIEASPLGLACQDKESYPFLAE